MELLNFIFSLILSHLHPHLRLICIYGAVRCGAVRRTEIKLLSWVLLTAAGRQRTLRARKFVLSIVVTPPAVHVPFHQLCMKRTEKMRKKKCVNEMRTTMVSSTPLRSSFLSSFSLSCLIMQPGGGLISTDCCSSCLRIRRQCPALAVAVEVARVAVGQASLYKLNAHIAVQCAEQCVSSNERRTAA